MELGGRLGGDHGNVGDEAVMAASRRADQLILGALTICLLAGTCLLPYRFPPRYFVVGASYEVGFNNTISFLAYLLFVPLLALVTARLLPAPTEGLPTTLSWKVSRGSHVVAAVVILAHAVLFAGLYAYKGRFVFGEGLYFQSLLYRMTRGEVPYIDFSFYYGPLMLYPAYWLTRLLGLDAGYGLWFVTTYLVGLLFLYLVVGFCVRDARATAVWFTFLALGLFNPLTGLNVTFTRYLFPSAVFLAAAEFLRRGGWTYGAIATAILAAALTYSFEVAALGVGVTGLLGLGYLVSSRALDATPTARQVLSRGVALLVAATIVCVVVFFVVDPSGRSLIEYPGVASSYSGGAHNVPIYPHLPFLALALVTVGVLAALTRIALGHLGNPLMPGIAAYAILAMVTERAAFAAAEPSHFAYFGLPIVLVGLFATSCFARARAFQAGLVAALLVGIMLPMQYYYLTEFLPFFAQRLGLSVAGAAGPSDSPPSAAGTMSLDEQLRDAVRTLGTERPYLMYEMEYYSLPVYRDMGLRYAIYNTMLITARDHVGIRRAIDEIRARHAIVIVRKQNLAGLESPRRSTGVWRLLDTLSGAHTNGSDLNAILLKSKTHLNEPFLEFVQTEYRPLYDQGGLVAYGP